MQKSWSADNASEIPPNSPGNSPNCFKWLIILNTTFLFLFFYAMYFTRHYVECSSFQNKYSITNEICHLKVKGIKITAHYWKSCLVKLEAIIKLLKSG